MPASAIANGGHRLVGLGRFELPTPRLSSVCSNQLSYRPVGHLAASEPVRVAPALSKLDRTTCTLATPDLTSGVTTPEPWPRYSQVPDRSEDSRSQTTRTPGNLRLATRCALEVSRKEVIQPQVLLQLPCYDFTPITNHTLGACFPCGLARRLLVQPAFVM